MEAKTQLRIKLQNTENRAEKSLIRDQIQIIENYLSIKCAEKNKDLVNGYIKDLENHKGSFSQHGLWKLKSKLCQKSVDPPTAKRDSNGQFITSPNLLKDL